MQPSQGRFTMNDNSSQGEILRIAAMTNDDLWWEYGVVLTEYNLSEEITPQDDWYVEALHNEVRRRGFLPEGA
jgi:hypothetical protein